VLTDCHIRSSDPLEPDGPRVDGSLDFLCGDLLNSVLPCDSVHHVQSRDPVDLKPKK